MFPANYYALKRIIYYGKPSTPYESEVGYGVPTKTERFVVLQVSENFTLLYYCIVAIECDKDHSHIFLNALPTLSPADIMAKIKGVTSKKLREEFPHLQHLPSLWTRSYFVSTAGNVSSETIKRYVEQRKTRG
jgi:REP element-mobilizing transposase RayT